MRSDDATEAEQAFWRALEASPLRDLEFRRNVVIGNYMADYCCHEARVIVEFDGDAQLGCNTHDAKRKAWFEEQGYRVFRFGSEIIHQTDDEILHDLYLACEEEPSAFVAGSSPREGGASSLP